MKIILILGILAMLASGYFAWNNFEELKSTRIDKDDRNAEIRRILTEIQGLDGETRARFAVLTDVEAERDETIVTLNESQRRLATLTAQAETLTNNLAQEEAKIARYERDLERLPAGMTIDNVRERLDQMRETLEARTAEIANLDGEISTLEEGIARNEDTLDGYVSRQADRRRAFDLNSSEGIVTAINRDWGFAVVNMGERNGVSPDSIFIVKRGTTSVGKLSVMAVESNSTVCNINYDTIPAGIELQAGDRVILENLHR